MAPYDYEVMRQKLIDKMSGQIASGPWNPPDGWWSVPSWRFFKPFSVITVAQEEHLTETYISEGPDVPGGGPPFNRDETITEQWYNFDAVVTSADMWWGTVASAPEGKSVWRHDSKTPFGSGLYMCTGQFLIRGVASHRIKVTNIYTAHGSAPVTDVRSDVTTDYPDANITSSVYTSDHTAINGLSTPCLITFGEFLHASGGEIGFPYPEQEEGPDGLPGEEKYFSDTALASMAGGAFNLSMQLLASSVGDDSGDYGNWSKSYSRTGTLDFNIG